MSRNLQNLMALQNEMRQVQEFQHSEPHAIDDSQALHAAIRRICTADDPTLKAFDDLQAQCDLHGFEREIKPNHL